jgi:glycine cleavage system transcriptional repressor
MVDTALISIFAPDRTGLVAAVTGCLFDLGVNLADTAFAVLGGGAEFTAVCELPQDLTLDAVAVSLERLPELADAEVSVTPFGLAPVHAPSGNVTHRIMVRGGDRPGLIARLCEVFVQFNANVVRLNSEKIPGPGHPRYAITISVWIPGGHEASCLNTVANTAGELGLECRWEGIIGGAS